MVSRKPNPKKRIKRQNNVMTSSFYVTRQSTIEPTDQSMDKDIEMNSNLSKIDNKNNDSDDEIEVNADKIKDVEKPSEIGPHIINPMIQNENDEKNNDNENHEHENMIDKEAVPDETSTELDWVKFGRAIDRITRFILPIAFFIGSFNLYHSTSNRCTPGLKACYVEPLSDDIDIGTLMKH
jgi:hypothetical protein